MKTVVVTGASRGIGLATAQQFLAEGWRVVGTFHRTPLTLQHPNFSSLPLDLASGAGVVSAAHAIAAAAPRIDVLVNNAGVLLDYGENEPNADHLRETLEVNLLGTIALTQSLLPQLSGGGHIVNISSDLGSFSDAIGEWGMLGYRMSKAALNMYTRLLAEQVKDRGILVSSLSPGWVNTDMGNVGGQTSDRQPNEVAADIFALVTTMTDIQQTGNFWHQGVRREW